MKYLNNYLVKALDAYPYDLESTIESLQYALSADEKNPLTFTLLARVYAEQFQDYTEAIQYYEKAIAIDLDNPMIYSDLARAFILNEDYDKARKTLDYALTIKGSNKDILLTRSVWLLEKQGLWKKAIKELKALRMQVCSNDYNDWIEKCEVRLKAKLNKGKKSENRK